jgi:hypothetical protein
MHMLNSMKRKAAFLVAAFCVSISAIAQDVNGLWHTAPAAYMETHGRPALKASTFKIFTTSEIALKGYLGGVQDEYAKATIIALPTADGEYRNFRIWATPVMEAPLALKYPGIKTYTAEAVDRRQVTAKIDYTEAGFHAMVFDGNNTYLIDPFSGKPNGAYIAYYKRDVVATVDGGQVCELDGSELLAGNNGENALRIHGTLRRQYRLALAADSEYCVAVAGINPTKAAVLAKMVTTMNRVNGIYEREIAVTMLMIANTDTLIFNTTAPDPYTNSSASTMLGQNQATVNARIGSANYDIGHVFGTGGGGIAQKGSVCSGGSKARGVTGSTNPQGDAFDIDYVAHEMGHQFGGDHTFNASTGSCAGNGVGNTSFEPGSGSTIMGYAGICGGGNDYQAHSDAYFHSASLEQITSFITTGNGALCPITSASTNQNASLAGFTASYSIPFRTPFELTAPQAIDATADTITYCWEQRNTGGNDFGKTLATTHIDGPLFRSFPPSVSPTRVFPALNRLITGASTPGEKLPDTARTMTFKVTERDVYQGWGTFNFPDDAISLDVIQTVAPFTVSLPDASTVWTAGSYQVVVWDVAGTTATPISANNVDIMLSLNGGATFPYMLASGTTNDGIEGVFVPHLSVGSNKARVKVKGSGNVFFNINPGEFEIVPNPAGVGGTSLPEGIVVSPTPATSELRIAIPNSIGAVQTKLVNTVGQNVWSGAVRGTGTIPVRDLPRGVYYLLFIANGESTSRKVLLQ